jgi:Putative amidoligase enzyme
MLNVIIRNQIAISCHRLLYDSRMVIDDPVVRDRVMKSVKELRLKYKSKDADKLKDKLIKYTDKITKKYTPGGWYKEKCAELIKKIYEAKRPPNDGQWRSIEFELIFKSKLDQDEFANAARWSGYSQNVTIKHDGSIKRNADDATGVPQEVVVSYQVGKEDVVHKICGLLKGRAYVNQTCGTHVHFDMRHISDAATAYGIGLRLAQAVPALKLLLPKSRRANKFCSEIINAVDCDNSKRYAFINMNAYTKYKTIEVRGHSGTIRADKILGWINLCGTIMAMTAAPKSIETIDALIETYTLNDTLKEYVRSRFAHFNVLAELGEGEEKIVANETASTPIITPPLAVQVVVPQAHMDV